MGACSSKPRTRDLEGAIEPSKKSATEDPPPENVKSDNLVIKEEGDGTTASAEIPQESRDFSLASAVLRNLSAEEEELKDGAKVGEENVKEEASKGGLVAIESEGGEVKVGVKDDVSQGEVGSGRELNAECLAKDSIEEKVEALHIDDPRAAKTDQAMEVSNVPKKDLDSSVVHTDSPVVLNGPSVEPADVGGAPAGTVSKDAPILQPTALSESSCVAAEMNDVPCEETPDDGAVPKVSGRDNGPPVEPINGTTVSVGANTVSEMDDAPSMVQTDIGATSTVGPEPAIETTDVHDPPVEIEAGTDVVSNTQGSLHMDDAIYVKEVEDGDEMALIPNGNITALGSEGSTMELPQEVKVDEAGGGESYEPADPPVEKVFEKSIVEGIAEPRDEAIPSDDGQPQESKTEAMAGEVGIPETTPRETDTDHFTKLESVQADGTPPAPKQGGGKPTFKDASDLPAEPKTST